MDLSGNNNHGTLDGPTWVSENGVWGLSYDGTDDFVNCGNDLSLNGLNNLSLMAWVKTSSTAGYQEVISMVSAADRYMLNVQQPTGYPRFIIRVGTGATSVIDGNTEIRDGQWHFLTGVREDGTLFMYIDGDYNTEGVDLEVGAISPDDDLWLGRRNTIQYPFDGSIGIAQVYNRALTNAEIRHNYELTRGLYRV
jgi:hypothetical protein